MKKVILYTICAFLFTGNAFSQLKVGVRGGFNINNIKLVEQPDDAKITYESGLGFHFGLTSQLEISKLYIQPELLFSTVTHDVKFEDIANNGASEIGRQRFNKIDIPIIVGLKFDNNFKIGAGPVLTRVVSSKSDILDDQERKKATMGFQLAAGFDWDNFGIEARYEGNLKRYGEGVRIGAQEYYFDERSRQLIISAALYF